MIKKAQGLDTYLEFPVCLRTSPYTSNQIESVNSMIKTETKKRRLINSEDNGIIVLASAFIKYERKLRKLRGFTKLTKDEKTSMEFDIAA